MSMKLSKMNPDTLYDKMLGVLVGSAIGDAMGAPTEMWSRQDIQIEYGFVEGLDSMVREPSAEGIWDYNLPAGSTTDDTRWKALLVEYLIGTGEQIQPFSARLDAKTFAQTILDRYESGLAELKATEGFELDPYEAQLRRIAWLKEWARVAKPYKEGNLDAYSHALSQFYGGEMVCAGMLFAPMIGACYPGDPAWAYEQTYQVDIFDIGYARDISGITAAMVAAALPTESTQDSVIKTVREVDPKGYFKSRLVGRTSYKLYKEAQLIVHEVKNVDPVAFFESKPKISLALPLKTAEDSLRYAQISTAYQKLDEKLMRYPFHPAEIHMVNLVALMLFDFDFVQTLSFVINYGRDNDTTGAVTGSILGAYWGASKLPVDLVEKVLTANKLLGFDLEAMARRMSAAVQSL